MKLAGLTNAQINTLKGKVSIRWRKSSATWVIYLSGQIVESGFNSEEDAEQALEDRYPELYNQYFEQSFK